MMSVLTAGGIASHHGLLHKAHCCDTKERARYGPTSDLPSSSWDQATAQIESLVTLYGWRLRILMAVLMGCMLHTL